MKIKFLINKFRLHIAMIFLVLGIFLPSKIPYVNLFAEYINSFIIWIVVLVVVGFRWRNLFLVSIGIFIVISLLTFMNKNTLAETLGNSVFLILVTATMLLFWEEIKGEK